MPEVGGFREGYEGSQDYDLAQGFGPFIGTSEQFDAFYRAERDKWARVIKASGMDKE